MTPQVIVIILVIINLINYGYRHGKYKEGKYNLFIDLIDMGITVGLIYWGGFFDPLFK